MDNNQFNQNTVMEQFESNFNKKRSPLAKTIIIVVVAVMCIGGFLFYQEMQKVRINLNRYLEVRVSGFDGYGNVYVNFDEWALVEDYAADLDIDNYFKLEQMEDYLEDCIDYEVVAPDDLKNGDTVTIKWKVDKKQFEKRYDCRLDYETRTERVSDLKDFVEYDPFKDIEVTFEGTAPVATADLDDNDVKYSFLQFSMDKSKDLKNGDVVTVSVVMDSDFEDKCISNGVVIKNLEKQYTVEGLNTHVTQMSEIPEENLTSMKAQAEDALNAYVSNNWKESITLGGYEYKGAYLMVLKDLNEEGGIWSTPEYNKFFLIYEVTVNTEEETFTYYYYAKFRNFLLTPDGTFSVDMSNYYACTDYYDNGFKRDGHKYAGFEKFETLYNKLVTGNVENYTYETTMKE